MSVIAPQSYLRANNVARVGHYPSKHWSRDCIRMTAMYWHSEPHPDYFKIVGMMHFGPTHILPVIFVTICVTSCFLFAARGVARPACTFLPRNLYLWDCRTEIRDSFSISYTRRWWNWRIRFSWNAVIPDPANSIYECRTLVSSFPRFHALLWLFASFRSWTISPLHSTPMFYKSVILRWFSLIILE